MRAIKLTKINSVGTDHIICRERMADACDFAKKILSRRRGIGADSLVILENSDGDTQKIRVFSASGRECAFSATAIMCTAKHLYKELHKSVIPIVQGEKTYTVRLSTMGKRVLCVWLEMPKIVPKPMEQLKYYHGIRGEVLRACISRPRVSVYEMCGAHAVFMLESCASLRSLNMQSVCRRLEEVLFYGEEIDLHFAAIAGDNSLALRTWKCKEGEICASCEGAVLASYAAREYETVDASRIIVKTSGGSFCVELSGYNAAICAKCETVFSGEV